MTWQDEAGVPRSGMVRLPLDHLSDTRAQIWLDRQGRVAPRPHGIVEIIFGVLLAGLLAGWSTWLASWRLRLLRHWWVAARAVKTLEEQWHDLNRERRSPPDPRM
ncbi:hypothetical protein [Nonomuraea sp. CA-141351]|uniref:hypothetical protein n=1 Tax=Nonomuraea sp. CA-141351 TaxID=3239996 RepID=UPI003D91DE07